MSQTTDQARLEPDGRTHVGSPIAEGTLAYDEPKGFKAKVTFAVIMFAIVAACGGLLLGFDNGIMGGVTANPDYQALFFPAVLEHKKGTGSMFCRYDDHVLSLVTSCLFLSAALSAIFGGWTCNKFGRKVTMLAAALSFGLGTALVACAVHVGMLIAGRLVLGVGVGLATQATPLYLTEMAPPSIRGALNIMFQLFITIGIFAAQAANFGTLNIPIYGWRVSFALGGIPALMMLLGSIFLPDTPNSLVLRGMPDQARTVLKRIRGTQEIDAEFDEIALAVEKNQSEQSPYVIMCMRRRSWPQLVICLVVPFFQQFTGINAIIFFSPQMFEAAGQEGSKALLSTVILGSVNVASTFTALLLVDRVGRRALFIEGGLQMLTCLGIIAALMSYNAEAPGANLHLGAALVAFTCLFVSGYAWSWGPLGWLVPSEIAIEETRAAGMGIATASNFLFTFLIGQTFLPMLCAMTWGVFLFFAGFVILMTIFVILCVPETKGVPVEEVDDLVNNHWLWSKLAAEDGALPRAA